VEYGLYSNDEFARLSESFVCVRTYVGLPGADAMLKQYGIVGTRGRKGPWVQGNNIDYVFFSPGLKPLTHEGLKEVVPAPTVESQNSIRWRYTVAGAGERGTMALVATQAMKKILEIYPPRDKKTIRIPWQLNASAAIHFASYEDRRIVLVPTIEGAASHKLADSLADPAVLRKHVHNYAFLKLAREQVPAELREAMNQAGPDGLVIVERPEGRPPKDSPWESAQVLAASPGPHTPASVLELLDKHARAPGWDSKFSAAR
jgi:hypothetical protein